MDYEKKYKEALRRAKTLIEKLESNHIKGFIYDIFPELIESDDERIREDIVFYIAANHKDDGEKARWLYYLEKQGEQKFAEWSKEDEAITLQIEQIIKCASFLNIVPEKLNKINKWLKSLKQRIKE